MATQQTEPVRRGELAVLATSYLVLAAVGVMLGVIGTFLVPLRMFGGIEGWSALLAFVSNAAVGSLGGIGTRSFAGAMVPTFAWFLTAGVLATVSRGGDVVFPGKLLTDPGVVVAGEAYLILGVIGGAIALVVTARHEKSNYTKRVNAPTPSA